VLYGVNPKNMWYYEYVKRTMYLGISILIFALFALAAFKQYPNYKSYSKESMTERQITKEEKTESIKKYLETKIYVTKLKIEEAQSKKIQADELIQELVSLQKLRSEFDITDKKEIKRDFEPQGGGKMEMTDTQIVFADCVSRTMGKRPTHIPYSDKLFKDIEIYCSKLVAN
jgi:hypothetical protein